MSGPFRIWDSIYMVGSPEISHSMDCCVYLVDAGELVLIDAGAGKSADQLIDNILTLGMMPEKLAYLIVTHAHIDHIGALSDLQNRYHVKIIAHEANSKAIETGNKVGAEYYGVEYRPCVVDIKLQGEESRLKIGVLEFKFLHIPGHTPGSIAAIIEAGGKRILFGQDIHGPYLSMWGGDPKEAKKSLQKLKAVKADILCEGHYGVIEPADEIGNFIQEFLDNL